MGTTLHLPLLCHRYAIDIFPTTTRRHSDSLKTGFRTSSFVPLRRIHGPGTMLTIGLNQSKAGNKICPTLRTTGATRAAPATVCMAASQGDARPFGPFPDIDQNFNDGNNETICSIILYLTGTGGNQYIEGIKIVYNRSENRPHMHGAQNGTNNMIINIASTESIVRMSGYYGIVNVSPDLPGVVRVRSLRFVKNTGETLGPFGPPTGTGFESRGDGTLVGFFGRANDVLESIGANFRI